MGKMLEIGPVAMLPLSTGMVDHVLYQVRPWIYVAQLSTFYHNLVPSRYLIVQVLGPISVSC